MEKKFEIIDHTADIGIVAYGRNLNRLFSNAARGLFSLITDVEKIAPNMNIRIELEEQDIEALLVAWLNELLYDLDVDHILFKDFDVIISENRRLSANCFGEKIDLKKHYLRREIKAATYHDLNISKINRLYSARIIFDI